MTPRGPAEVSLRPLGLEDAVDLWALHRRCRAADGEPDEASFEEFVHHTFALPSARVADDAVAALDGDGALVGFGWVFKREIATRRARAWLLGGVDPDHRRMGVGTRIVRHGIARATELLVTAPAGVPRHIDADAAPDQAGRIALLEQEGFTPIRTFMSMTRDLSGDDANATGGAQAPVLRFADWSADLDEATRDAHNDAFRDHWGSEPISVEHWRHLGPDSLGFRAAFSVLAIAPDGRIAGYTMCSEPPGMQAARRTAWIGTVGVRREFRGRGVGRAVLRRTLRAMAAAGIEHVGLDVDAENPTGAVRVYERLGFVPARRQIIYSRVVPEPGV